MSDTRERISTGANFFTNEISNIPLVTSKVRRAPVLRAAFIRSGPVEVLPGEPADAPPPPPDDDGGSGDGDDPSSDDGGTGSDSTGLSTGAIIGIIVGAAVFLLLILILVLICRRHQRKT